MNNTDWKTLDSWCKLYQKIYPSANCHLYQRRWLNDHEIDVCSFYGEYQWSGLHYESGNSCSGNAATLDEAKEAAEQWAKKQK